MQFYWISLYWFVGFFVTSLLERSWKEDFEHHFILAWIVWPILLCAWIAIRLIKFIIFVIESLHKLRKMIRGF